MNAGGLCAIWRGRAKSLIFKGGVRRDIMSEKVSQSGRTSHRAWTAGGGALYGATAAERKYLNAEERGRVLGAARRLASEQALFALVLAWTGARASEMLALCPMSFQIEAGTVTIRTLKRRRLSMREVPIPPDLMQALDRHYDLRRLQSSPATAGDRLWPWCRQTAWRFIKRLMADAGVNGRRATPRGLRHAFGVGTLQAGVPLNLVQKWLGHASMTTTAVYADASGPEEAAFAQRFWEN